MSPRADYRKENSRSEGDSALTFFIPGVSITLFVVFAERRNLGRNDICASGNNDHLRKHSHNQICGWVALHRVERHIASNDDNERVGNTYCTQRHTECNTGQGPPFFLEIFSLMQPEHNKGSDQVEVNKR